MKRPPPAAHFALAEELIARVAAYMVLPVAEVAAPGRGQDPIVLARHLVWSVLSASGLNPSEIARLFARNHSSIVHALRQMQVLPDRRSLLERFSATLPSRLRPAAHPTLPTALSGLVHDESDLSPSEQASILAYVNVAFLGGRPPLLAPLAPYHGHRLLADRPTLTADVRRTLARFVEVHPPRQGNVPPALVARPLPWLEISR